jgi:hypothetical protein
MIWDVWEGVKFVFQRVKKMEVYKGVTIYNNRDPITYGQT